MTTMPAYMLTPETLSITWEGKVHNFTKGSPQYTTIRAAILRDDVTSIGDNFTPEGLLKAYLGANYKVEGRKVFYITRDSAFFAGAGPVTEETLVEVPSTMTDRIFAMITEGKDPSPVLRFYERLQKNPSMRSVEQLFPFLAHEGIPLEADGTFLAYKGLNDNYTDKHTGVVDNKPGQHHVMPRNRVSDDPDHACHYGYHVGSLTYARDFASGGPVVICRVDPEHVVCVPHDCSQQKMRVCEYTVVGNWNGVQMPSTVSDSSELPAMAKNDNDLDESGDFADDYPDEGDDNEIKGDAEPKGMRPEIAEVVAGLIAEPEEVKPEPKKAAPNFGRLEAKKLMEKSIDELRKYASARLKILGASKMPGGKTALVTAILKTRRRMKKH